MLGWELPPHNAGGMGVACYHLSKALALEGTSIDFVVPYEAPHDSIDFMKVHGATELAPQEHADLGVYDSTHVTSDDTHNHMRSVQKQYANYVEHLVGKKDFDAIHAHDWLTMEAGVRAKQITHLPLIVHVHATEFERAGGNDGNPLIHEIEYQGLLVADRIIAVSQLTKDVIVEKYGIDPVKIEVVHNALDIDSFDPDYKYDTRTYRYLEGLKAEGYTIVSSVSRLTIMKGLTYLIRAFAKASRKYDRLVLLLAGDGEQRDELILLASELGVSDKVFFTGFVRGKQWRDAFSAADIYVMSSSSEPFGLGALEAAHHDNAIIITRQSGVGEVLSNTFKYDFWDIDRLADQLIGIATSPALQESLRLNVANEYARLSWKDVAKKCVALYSTARVRVPA